MIIPWQDISPDALDNLIESFVLREGTDDCGNRIQRRGDHHHQPRVS